jgi:N-succinyl-L-ornithine transcarbamylase
MESATATCRKLTGLTIAGFRKATRPKVWCSLGAHPVALPQCVANSFAEWMVAGVEVDYWFTQPTGFDLAPEFIAGGLAVVHNQATFARTISSPKTGLLFENYGAIGNHPVDGWNHQRCMFMHCLPVRRNVVVATGN